MLVFQKQSNKIRISWEHKNPENDEAAFWTAGFL